MSRTTVTVWPSTIEPEIVGPLPLTGAVAVTVEVGFEAAVCEPDEFVAATRMLDPIRPPPW